MKAARNIAYGCVAVWLGSAGLLGCQSTGAQHASGGVGDVNVQQQPSAAEAHTARAGSLADVADAAAASQRAGPAAAGGGDAGLAAATGGAFGKAAAGSGALASAAASSAGVSGAATPRMSGAAAAGASAADGGRSATAGSAGVAAQPAAAGSSVDADQLPAITLYLAGDSTVMDYGSSSAQEGWGQELKQYLTAKVSIDNQAIGGRSIQSFMFDDAANTMQSSRWSAIQKKIRAGDYLMVQFGTNDSSGIAGRAVTPDNFQTLLGMLIDAIKAKGATAILVTPSALQEWTNGREGNTRLAPYVAAMNEIAPRKAALVDDLNARSVELLNMVGQNAAMQIYINGDKAHFTKSGATRMALIVAQELRRIGSPLAAYLKDVP
jgi:lysophospholipase L1-like esterase